MESKGELVHLIFDPNSTRSVSPSIMESDLGEVIGIFSAIYKKRLIETWGKANGALISLDTGMQRSMLADPKGKDFIMKFNAISKLVEEIPDLSVVSKLEKKVADLEARLKAEMNRNQKVSLENQEWYKQFQVYIAQAFGYIVSYSEAGDATGFACFQDAVVTLIKEYCKLRGIIEPEGLPALVGKEVKPVVWNKK
jgi:hypothetical protein